MATFIKELVLELPAGEAVPFRAAAIYKLKDLLDLLTTKTLTSLMSTEKIGTSLICGNTSLKQKRQLSELTQCQLPRRSWDYNVERKNCFSPPRLPNVEPGKMSSWIFDLKPGDDVVISRPFGEFYARETKKRNDLCWRWCGRPNEISYF